MADGTVLEFPDGTADSVIDKVVRDRVREGAQATMAQIMATKPEGLRPQPKPLENAPAAIDALVGKSSPAPKVGFTDILKADSAATTKQIVSGPIPRSMAEASARDNVDPNNDNANARVRQINREVDAEVAAAAEARRASTLSADNELERAGIKFWQRIRGMGAGGGRAVDATLTSMGVDPAGTASQWLKAKARSAETYANAPVEGEATWEDVKAKPNIENFAQFILEQGASSAADMGVLASGAGIPAYVGIQSGSIGQQRAENNGRANASGGDVLAAVPAATMSAALERLGNIGIFDNGAKTIIGRIVSAGGIEGLTETLQSGVEYAGSNLGTKAGFKWAEAGDQALAGLVAGTAMGGAFRTVGEGVDAATGALAARDTGPDTAVNADTAITPRPVAPGVRETAAATIDLTPGDQASPIPTDLIAEGKASVADAKAAPDADVILAQAGIPATGKRVAVTMPDGKVHTGTVADAFNTDAGELGVAAGVKIAMDDGSTLTEHFDTIAEAGVKIAEIDPRAEADAIDAQLAMQANGTEPSPDVVPEHVGARGTPVENAKAIVKALHPTANITSWTRPVDGVGSPTSWHKKSKAAVDVTPIKGMSFNGFVQSFKDKGYSVLEAIDEVAHPSKWSTGPHWHIVLGVGSGEVAPQTASNSAGSEANTDGEVAPSEQPFSKAYLESDTEAAPEPDRSSIRGEPIDNEWSRFTPESGTLGIPRADMPQIKAEHRGAMVNFLNARGISHAEETIPAARLKPTQAEFSPVKVQKASEFTGGDRAILVSKDGHVVDGHHQWLAKHDAGEDVRAIRLNAPIRELLKVVPEMPSATTDENAAQLPESRNGAPKEIKPAAGLTQAQMYEAIRGNKATTRVGDLQGNDTGWMQVNLPNGDGAILIHSQKHEAREFRGKGWRQYAPAYAIDNAVEVNPTVSKTEMVAAPTVTDTSTGKSVIIKGASPELLAAIKTALPDKVLPVENKKLGGIVYSKKHEAKIRAVLAADSNSSRPQEKPSPPTEENGQRDQGVTSVREAEKPAAPSQNETAPTIRSDRTVEVPDAREGRIADGEQANPTPPAPTKDQTPPVSSFDRVPAEKPTYGTQNKVFTSDAAEKARALLKSKMTQINSGFDPEIAQAGLTLMGYHIEAGARAFIDAAHAVAADLGVTPADLKNSLRSWYMAARMWMEDNDIDVRGMDDADVVRVDLARINQWGATSPVQSAMQSSENEDGIQGSLPRSDARTVAPDVQRTAPERSNGIAPRGESQGSAGDVRPTDSGGRENAGRSGSRSEDTPGSRGTGSRDTDRVSPERSVQKIRGTNWRIERGSLDEGRSAAVKARDNIKAIEIVKQLDSEGRLATHEEQQAIAKYVGWGGLKNAFADARGEYGKGFEDVGPRLRELLTDEEYETANRSIQYAHYTSETIVRSMWDMARRFGFKGGTVFEPGMGTGNFAGMMPGDIAEQSRYQGIEFDHLTSRIAHHLYPKWGVTQADYTRVPAVKDVYDLVIGNPPFSETVINADPEYAGKGFMLHDYFFAKSLDAVRPGGLLMFITSAGTMNKISTKARDYLADRADLVGAIRLPGNAFEENAGTSVTTDIVMLRKRLPGEAIGDRAWTETVERTLPTRDGTMTTGNVSRYFSENPEMVLGEEGMFDKLVAGVRYAVRAPKGYDLGKGLREAMNRLPAMVMSEPETGTDRAKADFDLTTTERKDGSFYIGEDGRLMQMRGNVGRPVQGIGKGVKGGISGAAQERIKALVPIRDALRDVYAHDLASRTKEADSARVNLNKQYDAFVAKYGPINKAEISYRRPSVIEQESARAEMREEERLAGREWNEGSFDPSALIASGARVSEIAAARKQAREAALAAGATWDEGSFNPDDMPDKVVDKRPNIDPFMDDQEGYRLRAIEHYNDDTGDAKKSNVFFENVITKERAPTINSPQDALLYSMNRLGRPDMATIAGMAGMSQDDAVEALGDAIFPVPGADGSFQTREQYLSGNVRKKLEQARLAAENDPRFSRNATALEAVQPLPLGPSDIAANLGMPWLPSAVIEDFGKHLGLASIKVSYQPKLAQWTARGDMSSAAAVSTWGTSERSAPDLITDALNRQNPKIYKEINTPDGRKRVLDAEATQAAQDKVNEIKQEFRDWIWNDEERTKALVDLYNREYNSLVAPKYDGSYLTTPGISSDWSWRPHQSAVVARIIQAGNTYMAHEVGAGKTSAMIGAGMEMRRLGLVKKPMYAVPNHMLGQFTKEFYEQYPTARIAVADERQFHTDRRKQFVANIASQDLDAVIITHSAFAYIPLSAEFTDRMIGEEIREYRDILNDMSASDPESRFTRRNIQQKIEQLEQRLSGKGQKKRDSVFTFEETGVDFLFVDEAHLFRKLDFATKMSNVKGIDPNGSKMSFDLFAKTRYLEGRRPGRSIVLASGTPITNTMAELYSVSRYLQMNELEERGLTQFDAWAGAFGDTATELEQDPAGGYKTVTRFSKFVNVPELSVMVRQVMDVVTGADLDQYVTRPKLKGGERKMHVIEQTMSQSDYQDELKRRMKAIENRKGPPQKGDDIMLSIIGDGRKSAIDYRLIDATARKEPSKLEEMIDNVERIWKETKRAPFHAITADGYSDKPVDFGPAGQMVFSDFGINGDFPVQKYVAAELQRRGIPKGQIAIISDFKSHVAKQRLFNDMNEGKVRILIGSVAKMGTGVNAQRRLYALHNMDAQWFPANDQQRNGRIIRQGNMNPEVEIHDYSTKGTYDSTMWGMMARKARFIEGFMRGDPTMRDMEDLGEASQYEQAKALSTADPRIAELTEWKQDYEKMQRRRIAFGREIQATKNNISNAEFYLAQSKQRIPAVEADIAQRVDVSGDKFSGTVGSATFDKRVEFGEALLAALDDLPSTAGADGKLAKIAKIGGFDIGADIYPGIDGPQPRMFVMRNGGHETPIRDRFAEVSAVGTVTRITNILGGFERELADLQNSIDSNTNKIAEFKPLLERTFGGDKELRALRDKINTMEGVLEAENKPQSPDATTQFLINDENGIASAPAKDREAIAADLRSRMERVGVEPKIALRVVDTIAGSPHVAGQFTTGITLRDGKFMSGLITVAMSSSSDAMFTLNHETVHAMRHLGLFRSLEWQALVRRATNDETLMASINRRYGDLSEEARHEEAVADMFAGWSRDRAEKGFIGKAFARIQAFISALRSWIDGNGWTSAEDVMRAIEDGAVGARVPSNITVKWKRRKAKDSRTEDVPTFDNEETEARFQKAREGIGTAQSLHERVSEFLSTGWHGISRHWIALPNTAEYADLQQKLRTIEAAPQTAKERTVAMLDDMVKDFTPADLDLFTRKVILDDLIWDSTNERELPFGFTAETLAHEKAKIDQAVQAQPGQKVWKAAMKRKLANRKIADELVAVGVLEAEQIKNPAYYRHQVLEYAMAEQKRAASAAGVGARLRSPKWAKRMGSSMDINANLLEAEFDWLNKAFTDVPIAKTIEWIKQSKHNILADLQRQAREGNKAGVDAALEAAQEILDDPRASSDEQEKAAMLIDTEKGFRKNIAMGFANVRAALRNGGLSVPKQFERAADAIENQTGDTEAPPFAFLSWILDSNELGSMGAAMILKAIGQRRAWTAKLLGKAYVDPNDAEALAKQLAPEGYRTWQPDEGKLLFTVKTLPEHVIDRMIEKLDAPQGWDKMEFRAALEGSRNALSMGGSRYTMILPEDVADTLNNLKRVDLEGLFDLLVQKPMRAWKRWVLINPRRVIKYNINNMTGDLDVLVAGNPRALRRSGAAAKELAAVMRGKAKPSARYQEAVERGVFDSGLSIQEIPDLHMMDPFERFAQKPGPITRMTALPLRKAWNALQGATQWRENIFRYAAYLEYADRIEAGESQSDIGYGASVPKMVDAVTDPKDRAALLARDLLGDYGAISHYGAGIRKTVIPFWSWMEINTKRYWRLTANAYSQGVGKGIAVGTGLAAVQGVRTTAWLGIRMAMIYGLLSLWNELLFPEEEDELDDVQRNQLHIILGRNAKGEVMTLRTQGAASDALGWFGLGDTMDAAHEYELGRNSLWDILSAPPKAVINKIGTSVSPAISLPIESATGKKLWPDLFDTRQNRDRWRNVMATFSLENEYDALLDRPSRGYARSWQEALIYRRDPGEIAYNQSRGIAYDWLEREKGQAFEGGFSSARANATRDYRTALKFGDKTAADKAIESMVDLGVTDEDLSASIKRAHPLGPIAKKDRKAFLDQLTDKELETFQRAELWYQEVFTPQ